MAKSYRQRRIFQPPLFKSFKPVGIPRRVLDQIVLSLDEYEALRLAYYQNMEHLQASKEMCISRPTFTRVIEKARQKMVTAIVEGKELVIEGGNISFINNLHRCKDCGDLYTVPYDEEINDCPECGSQNIENLAEKVKQ